MGGSYSPSALYWIVSSTVEDVSESRPTAGATPIELDRQLEHAPTNGRRPISTQPVCRWLSLH